MWKILAKSMLAGLAAVVAGLPLSTAADYLAFGQQAKTWGNFSLSMPPEWKEGMVSRDQDSWTFGDTANKKFGFFAFYLSRRKPETIPLEQGAKLTKLGPLTVSGRPATSFDMTYIQPDKRYRLIALDQPDAGGNYVFVMAGVEGLDFNGAWPMLEQVIGSLRWVEASPVAQAPVVQEQPNPPREPKPEPKPEPKEVESVPDPASMQAGMGITPSGWQRKTWKTYSLAVPAEWKETENSSRGAAWGQMNESTKKAVMFGVATENKPFDSTNEPGINISLIGATQLLGQPAKLLEVNMSSPDGAVKGKMILLALDLPDAEGRYLAFNAAVSNLPWEEHWPTLQKAFASITAAPAGGGTIDAGGDKPGTGVKPAAPGKLWDIVTVVPPAGWTDLGDPEGRLWMSETSMEPRAAFLVMRGKKVLENLAEMKPGPGEPGKLAGRPATFYTGNVSYYKKPVKVWLLDDCLPEGDRVGVMIGGNDPESQQGALDSALAALKFDLPQGAASCGSAVERSFQGVSMMVPAYFQCDRFEQYGTMECNGLDLSTLTELKVWLLMENVPYAKERGAVKDKFERIGQTTMGRAPASVFNAEIKGSEGIRPSRVITLDKPLKNGKNLSLEFLCPDGRKWGALLPAIDQIAATVRIDQALMPEGIIAAAAAPVPGDAQKTSKAGEQGQGASAKIDSNLTQASISIPPPAKTDGKIADVPAPKPQPPVNEQPPWAATTAPVNANPRDKTDAKIPLGTDSSKPKEPIEATGQIGAGPQGSAVSGLIGSWNSELGPVVFQMRDGKLVGYWLNDSRRRGEITEARVDGSTLTFDYLWPGGIRGQAAFTWNPQSQRWEGNWRHLDGLMGGWNLRK